MKACLLIIAIVSFTFRANAQQFLKLDKADKAPDTLYYKFYGAVQMIEIDHDAAWQREVGFHEATQPRAMSWSMLIPAPLPNVYLFRDTTGKIIRAYNSAFSLEEENKHFKNIPLKQKGKNMFSPGMAYHRFRMGRRMFYYSQRISNSGEINGFYRVGSMDPNPPNSINRISGKYVGLIDSFGYLVFPIIYEQIEKAGKHFLAKKDGMFGIIDHNSNIILPFEYDAVNSQTETAITFSQKGKITRIFDIKGSKVTAMNEYDWIDHERMEPDTEDKIAPLVKVGKGGKIGLINRKHLLASPVQYDYVDYHFKDGLLLVTRNNKWGYINNSGAEAIPCQYEDALAFDKGTASVMLDGKRICIDTRGQQVPECESRYAKWEKTREWESGEPYIKNRRIVQRHLYGLVDNNNNMIAPLIYQRMDPIPVYSNKTTFHQQYLKVMQNRKWGIIDIDGNVVLPPVYDKIDDYKHDLRLTVSKNELFGLLDMNMKWVVPCNYEGLNPYTYPGKIWFRVNNKWGLMNVDQTVIIEPKYDHTGWMKDGRIQVSIGNRFGFIDSTGKEFIPLIYEAIGYHFINGVIMVKQKGKWGYIDSTNRIIIPFLYEEGRKFEKKITAVQKGKKYGFINLYNQPVTGFIYDFVGHDWYIDGLVLLRKNNKIGFADETGNEVIPCIYDDERGFHPEKGHYLKKDNQWIHVKKP